MKKLLHYSSFIFTMMILIMTTGCTENSKNSLLLSHIPANTDFVVVGNVHNLVESIGGSTEQSKIRLPRYVTDLIKSNDEKAFDEFNSFLRQSGVDIDVCGLFCNYKDASYPIIVFSLSNRQQFLDAIEDEGYREKDETDGIVFYSKKVYESSYDPDYDDYGYIAVGEDFGYWIDQVWVGSSFKPMKVLSHVVDDLKDGSFADTPFGKYIKQGNAIGLAAMMPDDPDFNEFFKGIDELPFGAFCMHGSVSDDKITIYTKCMDREGHDIDTSRLSEFFDPNATINPEALTFLNKDESLVVAMSIKDFNWDKITDLISQQEGLSRSDRSAVSLATSYLEKIDGTVAMGLGVSNGLDSFFELSMGHQILSNISATLVVETKAGKAKTILNDLMGLMESESIPYKETTNGFIVSIDSEGSIYAKGAGNWLVISNHKIKKNGGNEITQAINFKDYSGASALIINHGDKLFKDLQIKNDIKVIALSKTDKMETKMTIEVAGGREEDSVMAKLVKMVINVIEQEKSIGLRYDRYRENTFGGSSYEYDDDTISVEDYYDMYDEIDSVVAEIE